MRIANAPILLIEDDDVDAMTVKRALRDLKVSNPLERVENGEEGLRRLRDAGKNMPCIILLDLNMPIMNGVEFLAAINEDTRLRLLPVVILTTSEEERDKLETFQHGIAGYMTKPVGYSQFVEVIRTINLYWTISELPPMPR